MKEMLNSKVINVTSKRYKELHNNYSDISQTSINII